MKSLLLRLAILAAVIAVAVALVVRSCGKRPDPVAVVRVDTIPGRIEYRDGKPETIPGRIEYRTDPKLSDELTRLRAEIAGQRSVVARLLNDYQELVGYTGLLQDSLMRLRLNNSGLLTRVEVRPRSVRYLTYRVADGQVVTGSVGNWRKRWTLTAGERGPVIARSRLPFEVEAIAGVRADWLASALDTAGYLPGVVFDAGLRFRRDWLASSISWRQPSDGAGGPTLRIEAALPIW